MFEVIFHPKFLEEWKALPPEVRRQGDEKIILLGEKGHRLGSPHVKPLRLSQHSKMKELRFQVLRVHWRIAFAFDPSRKAVLLAAISKQDNQQRRYQALVRKADERYNEHTKTP